MHQDAQTAVEKRAYTRSDFHKAVNTSAFAGWAVVVFVTMFLLHPNRGVAIIALPAAAVIGLPIAFVTCWLVGAPILWRLMKNPISWRSALLWGAIIGLTVGLFSLGIDRLQGWHASQNPNFHFRSGGGDFVREVDGVLTPYGWQVKLQNLAMYVPYGMVVALIVRRVIGPGIHAE